MIVVWEIINVMGFLSGNVYFVKNCVCMFYRFLEKKFVKSDIWVRFERESLVLVNWGCFDGLMWE